MLNFIDENTALKSFSVFLTNLNTGSLVLLHGGLKFLFYDRYKKFKTNLFLLQIEMFGVHITGIPN